MKTNPKITNNLKANLSEIPESTEPKRSNLSNTSFDFVPMQNKLYLRPFSKQNRKLIFALLFFINIVINMDHGIVPAGITSLQLDLKIDPVEIGLLGSFVFLGLTLGNY